MLATWGCTTFPKPTLSLDFLGATSLDSGITFSRGSQATLFDSTGTLRYAKHNLLLQSQDFATSWLSNATNVSTNVTNAPDGTATADEIIEQASTAEHNRFQNITTLPAVSYTISVFAKANTRSKLIIRTSIGGSFVNCGYDLAAGTVTRTPAGFTCTISPVLGGGGGWYRCTATVTESASASRFAAFNLAITDPTDNAAPSYAGDGTSGLFLWGAQLNLANMEGGVTSSLTTYYPTTTAAYYAPRFDYNPSTLQPRGLLIEEQRTNSIRNNTMQGAVAGTPGTLPTNWAEVGGGLGTLTRQIVGTGTENGITYIDLKFSGTTSTVSVGYAFEAIGGIAASNGQTWTNSFWCKLVAGSAANITSVNSLIEERTGAGGFLANTVSAISPTATLTRFPQTFTLNAGATVGQVRGGFILVFSSGVAIDITLRIGLPQLELGAFATSVIPTTTTALTRNADVASMTGTNFSSWYNATNGSLFVTCVNTGNLGFNAPRPASMSNGTNNNLIEFFGSTATAMGFQVNDGGVTQANIAQTANSFTANKLAGAYAANDFAVSINGAAVGTDASGTVPTVDRLQIGNRQDLARPWNGYIQRIAYYPTRLANAQLQALTA